MHVEKNFLFEVTLKKKSKEKGLVTLVKNFSGPPRTLTLYSNFVLPAGLSQQSPSWSHSCILIFDVISYSKRPAKPNIHYVQEKSIYL